ncbi:MAG: hypothetical protein LBF36_03830 [Mycoplasmataceae bacterium]|nr:hypothetical protein [Mycoplasmataceae bacterium]
MGRHRQKNKQSQKSVKLFIASSAVISCIVSPSFILTSCNHVQDEYYSNFSLEKGNFIPIGVNKFKEKMIFQDLPTGGKWNFSKNNLFSITNNELWVDISTNEPITSDLILPKNSFSYTVGSIRYVNNQITIEVKSFTTSSNIVLAKGNLWLDEFSGNQKSLISNVTTHQNSRWLLCTTQFLPSYFSIHDDWGNIYIELNSDNPVARGDNTTLTIPPNTIFQILSDNTIITNNEIVINFVVPTNKNLILQFGNSIPIGVSEFYTLLWLNDIPSSGNYWVNEMVTLPNNFSIEYDNTTPNLLHHHDSVITSANSIIIPEHAILYISNGTIYSNNEFTLIVQSPVDIDNNIYLPNSWDYYSSGYIVILPFTNYYVDTTLLPHQIALQFNGTIQNLLYWNIEKFGEPQSISFPEKTFWYTDPTDLKVYFSPKLTIPPKS